MSMDASDKLKSAKDSLVASLFELSKAASGAASNIVDFYNAIGDDEDEKLEAFTTLTESLQKLTSAGNGLHVISSELVNPMEDEKDVMMEGQSRSGSPSKVNSSVAGAISSAGGSAGSGDGANGGSGTTTGKGRKRAEKDPNAPKKPLTVFFAYSAYLRQEIRQEREKAGLPPLSSTEITQDISRRWKSLSESEKERWKQAYNVELVSYQKEKSKYLEAKKNGTLPVVNGSPSHARVGIPRGLQDSKPEKRSREDGGSSEKKKKKKKKDKKKDSGSSGNKDN